MVINILLEKNLKKIKIEDLRLKNLANPHTDVGDISAIEIRNVNGHWTDYTLIPAYITPSILVVLHDKIYLILISCNTVPITTWCR